MFEGKGNCVLWKIMVRFVARHRRNRLLLTDGDLGELLLESCEAEKASEEKDRGERLATGIVARLNEAIGGVEVGESAFNGAVERSGPWSMTGDCFDGLGVQAQG